MAARPNSQKSIKSSSEKSSGSTREKQTTAGSSRASQGHKSRKDSHKTKHKPSTTVSRAPEEDSGDEDSHSKRHSRASSVSSTGGHSRSGSERGTTASKHKRDSSSTEKLSQHRDSSHKRKAHDYSEEESEISDGASSLIKRAVARAAQRPPKRHRYANSPDSPKLPSQDVGWGSPSGGHMFLPSPPIPCSQMQYTQQTRDAGRAPPPRASETDRAPPPLVNPASPPLTQRDPPAAQVQPGGDKQAPAQPATVKQAPAKQLAPLPPLTVGNAPMPDALLQGGARSPPPMAPNSPASPILVGTTMPAADQGIQTTDDQNIPPDHDPDTSQPLTRKALRVVEKFCHESESDEARGKKVDDLVARALNSLLLRRVTDHFVADLMRTWRAPVNITNMRPIELNHHIVRVADSTTKRIDGAMYRAHASLLKAMVPIAEVANVEAKGYHIPAEEKLEKLLHGLRLAAISASRILYIRRDFVRSHIPKKYEGLVADRHPITTWLFGDDLQTEWERIDQRDLFSTLAGQPPQTTSSAPAFLGRGRGSQQNSNRGRGSQNSPHFHQQGSQGGRGRGAQQQQQSQEPRGPNGSDQNQQYHSEEQRGRSRNY